MKTNLFKSIVLLLVLLSTEVMAQPSTVVESPNKAETDSAELVIKTMDLITLSPIYAITVELKSATANTHHVIDTTHTLRLKFTTNTQYTLTLSKAGYDTLTMVWNDAYTPTHLNCYMPPSQLTRAETKIAHQNSVSLLAHEDLNPASPFKDMSAKSIPRLQFITYLLYFNTNGFLSGELSIQGRNGS